MLLKSHFRGINITDDTAIVWEPLPTCSVFRDQCCKTFLPHLTASQVKAFETTAILLQPSTFASCCTKNSKNSN